MIIINYIWIVILILAIVIELITPNLATIWFIPASLIALLLSLIKAPLWLQTGAFVVSGFVLLFTTKPFFEKLLFKGKVEKTNADALIGKTALVIEAINNIEEKGAVKIDGKIWSARNAENSEIIEEGAQVKLIEIQGVKLMCTKI